MLEWYKEFDDAKNAVAGNTLVVTKPVVMTDDITIPSTVAVEVTKRGGFVNCDTKTLTINGPFSAGLYPVFDGVPALSISQTGPVYPHWWKAKWDGVTDDSMAMKNACLAIANAGGGVLTLPPGGCVLTPTYSPDNFLLRLPANVRIVGSGKGITTIKCNATNPGGFCGALFYLYYDDNEISNLSIDMNGQTNIEAAIRLNIAARAKISDVRIDNVATTLAAIYVTDSLHCTFENLNLNPYTGTLAAQTSSLHGLFIVQTSKVPTRHMINKLRVHGGAFGLGLKNQENLIASDLVFRDEPGSVAGPNLEGINIDNCDSCVISNVVATGRHDAGISMGTTVSGQQPEFNVFANIICENNTLDGIYIGAGINNQFMNVICRNNNQGTPTYGPRSGINVNHDSGEITDRNFFNGVICTDSQTPKTQDYGVQVVGSEVYNTIVLNAWLDKNAIDFYYDSGTGTTIEQLSF